jgi:tmRNA-binding protein
MVERHGRRRNGVNRQHFLEQYLNIPVRNKKLLLRRRAMRQLIGKMPIKYRNVTEEIYLSECVRCQSCQATVPMGIEVVTVRNEEKSRTVIRHCWYCRAHGADYATRALG